MADRNRTMLVVSVPAAISSGAALADVVEFAEHRRLRCVLQGRHVAGQRSRGVSRYIEGAFYCPATWVSYRFTIYMALCI